MKKYSESNVDSSKIFYVCLQFCLEGETKLFFQSIILNYFQAFHSSIFTLKFSEEFLWCWLNHLSYSDVEVNHPPFSPFFVLGQEKDTFELENLPLVILCIEPLTQQFSFSQKELEATKKIKRTLKIQQSYWNVLFIISVKPRFRIDSSWSLISKLFHKGKYCTASDL